MNIWMVRAGQSAYLIEEFAKGYVGIGWSAMGDMSSIKSQKEMKKKYIQSYPDAKPGKVGNAAAMVYKFCFVMK